MSYHDYDDLDVFDNPIRVRHWLLLPILFAPCGAALWWLL